MKIDNEGDGTNDNRAAANNYRIVTINVTITILMIKTRIKIAIRIVNKQ